MRDDVNMTMAMPMDDIDVERDSATPLHQQLSEQMLRWIEEGVWPPNHKLPIEPELAELLHVSRGTLRKAVSTLIVSGHLARVHGRGTFVLPPDLEQPLAQELIGIGDAFDRQGIEHSTALVAFARVPASSTVRKLLNLAGEDVLKIERVRSIASEPVALLHNYVDPDRVPGLVEYDFSKTRVFAALEAELQQPLDSARRTFCAQLATRDVARALRVGEKAAVLHLEQVTYLEDGSPIECSDVWFRGDKMKISAQLARPGRLGL
jgi:GntR family transcriptional regulator